MYGYKYILRYYSWNSIFTLLTTLKVLIFESTIFNHVLLILATQTCSLPQTRQMDQSFPNSIRDQLLRNEVASTLGVKLVRFVELLMMAKTAGFNGILTDMEHSSSDLDTTLHDGIAPIIM
jgi:hypothetical protein